MHDAPVGRALGWHPTGCNSRDSTANKVPETSAPKPARGAEPKRKRGRPRTGEERSRDASRLEPRRDMALRAMLDDLSKACDVGCRRNAKGRVPRIVDPGCEGQPLSSAVRALACRNPSECWTAQNGNRNANPEWPSVPAGINSRWKWLVVPQSNRRLVTHWHVSNKEFGLSKISLANQEVTSRFEASQMGDVRMLKLHDPGIALSVKESSRHSECCRLHDFRTTSA